MDKEAKPAPMGVSASGIMALVALVTGAVLYGSIPLKSTRPDVADGSVQPAIYGQDVDARLWQDPLGVIARALHDAGHSAEKGTAPPAGASGAAEAAASQASAPCGEGASPHTSPWMTQQIARRNGERKGNGNGNGGDKVEVLAVMLASGPFAEDIESRRRTRYAVVAGLNASRFEPEDSEHLGYFMYTPRDAAKGPAPDETPLPRVVPFEWFQSAVDARRRDDRPQGRHILVLWLDAGAFARAPIRQTGRMMDQLKCDRAVVRWRVLGPASSDGLKAMVDEAAEPASGVHPNPGLRVYSALATTSDSVLLEDVAVKYPSTDLATFFRNKGVDFVRTVADDEAVANALVDELVLRGLKAGKFQAEAGVPHGDTRRDVCESSTTASGTAPSRIAIVAEWDTTFGRSLRKNYRTEVDQPGFCVERFSYLRGLDGLVPQRVQRPPEAQDSAAAVTDINKPGPRNRDGPIERAEGQGQFDYLRRLAEQMRARDSELRHTHGNPGIQAIGVLGNDVHDKLLVLKALQPEFPNAVFFTTEMDQRLLHPREQMVTRNLIVGSNFGLELFRGLQAGVPPFRDSSQTAVFLTTRLALDDGRLALLKQRIDQRAGAPAASAASAASQEKIKLWLSQPRVFEIGRTRAFDFSKSDFSAQQRKNRNDKCRSTDWTACPDIHPEGTPMASSAGTPSMTVIFSVIVLGLWLPAVLIRRRSRPGERVQPAAPPLPDSTSSPAVAPHWAADASLSRPSSPRAWVVVARWVVWLIALQLVLPVWLANGWDNFAAWLTRDGKPLVAFEGISLWPTEGIRLFTTVLCVYLIWEAWSALDRNQDDIAEKLGLQTSRRDFLAEQRRTDVNVKPATKLRRIFSWEMFKSSPSSGTALDPAMSPEAIDFWQRQLIQNRLTARITRTAAMVVLAWSAGALLTLPLHEFLVTPHRGELSMWVHRMISVCAHLAISVLVFFVVDATVFCVSFVRGLRMHKANWPEDTLKAFEQRMDLPRGEHLDNWIDLQFVVLRTQVVGRLIYYPFLVLSLLLLSRSSMFDDWNMPMGAAFVAFNCVGAAIGCAVALRIMAERSRRHAIAALKDDLIRLHGETLDWARRAPERAAPHTPTARQLELLLSRIEGLRDGAFAPFSQQPLLKALLLPFAAFGGTTLLDALALVNL